MQPAVNLFGSVPRIGALLVTLAEVMMKRTINGITFIAASTFIATGSTADAATFNIEWSNLSAGEFGTTATGIFRTLNGVTVTATGYSVSVPSGGGSETVSGPLTAVDIADAPISTPHCARAVEPRGFDFRGLVSEFVPCPDLALALATPIWA